MQIGIAGLGRMGAAIAARLMETGHTVAVWNCTPEKAKPLVDAGAKQCATPEDLAEQSEVIITILTDADAIDHVYNGEHGMLSGDVADKLFIEMSTVRPKIPIALANVVRASGARFVECPVGGTTGPARQGKLFGFMGADEGRRRTRQADPRSALPAARACRPGRQRRAGQVHHQHAADDLLPGARRSVVDGAGDASSIPSG